MGTHKIQLLFEQYEVLLENCGLKRPAFLRWLNIVEDSQEMTKAAFKHMKGPMLKQIKLVTEAKLGSTWEQWKMLASFRVPQKDLLNLNVTKQQLRDIWKKRPHATRRRSE